MFLTCEKCQTVWRLDEKNLALGGRVVRCTACGNTWFEQQVKSDTDPAEDLSFNEVLAQAQALAQEMAPDDGTSRAIAPIPQAFELPVHDYQPGGMSATQFGALTFLLLFFVTVSGLFLLKGTIVRNFPVMTALYQAVGADLHAPGEGLALSELLARKSATGHTHSMTLAAKVSNISKNPLPYPALRVTLRGPYGVHLKDWDFPAGAAQLAPGETIPLDLSFKDIPEGGSTVDVRVTGP